MSMLSVRGFSLAIAVTVACCRSSFVRSSSTACRFSTSAFTLDISLSSTFASATARRCSSRWMARWRSTVSRFVSSSCSKTASSICRSASTWVFSALATAISASITELSSVAMICPASTSSPTLTSTEATRAVSTGESTSGSASAKPKTRPRGPLPRWSHRAAPSVSTKVIAGVASWSAERSRW
ncbi:hypothetical protein [Sorangium atrum]|uniref:hypothetical protein n=1 Tax=Sorangium atrum TaxID=2995308 RepID=UPI0040328B06